MWYRVELNKDGSVKSCTEVEASAVDGRHVRYVEAEKKADALELVARWWRTRASARIRDARKRARRKAGGFCESCGRPSREGRVRCQRCEDRLIQWRRDVRAGVRMKKEITDEDRVRTVLRRDAADKAKGNYVNPELRAYRKVLARYLLAADGFRAWLETEIKRLEGLTAKTRAKNAPEAPQVCA